MNDKTPVTPLWRGARRLLPRGVCAAAFAVGLGVPTVASAADASACTAAAAAADWVPPTVHTADATVDYDSFMAVLAEQRVIFLGEYHDRYEHHLNQVEVICRLRARGKQVAIGMEAFQQPFQSVLDAWVAGDVDEASLLRKSEYFSRWRFDYRLYAPILRYAREHGVPLVALNVPREITAKVADGGIASLTAAERLAIPDTVDRGNERYRERLREAYAMHPPSAQSNFEHFLEAQLLWDEGMAEQAAGWLQAHPGSTLVVIAGEGHVTHGDGIPGRLGRRLDVSMKTVLQSTARLAEADAADYRLDVKAVALPPTGRLGVLVEEADDVVLVRELTENSAAREAGVEPRDRIVSINGQPVTALADVRIALFDKAPGTRVSVELARAARGDAPFSLPVRLR